MFAKAIERIKDIVATKKLSKHDAYKKEWLGKFVDVDCYPKSWVFQCVDLVKHYVNQVYWFRMWYVGSAKDCSMSSFNWDKRRKEYKPWKEDMKQWDVLISAPTKTNKHWHIWIFESSDSEWYVIIEQNWWGKQSWAKIKWNEIRIRHIKRWNPSILKFFRYTP